MMCGNFVLFADIAEVVPNLGFFAYPAKRFNPGLNRVASKMTLYHI